MTYILPFETTHQLKDLCSWLQKRQAHIPADDEMPKVGVMVYVDGTAVAACFLRMVEGGTAMLDGLTTNPESSAAARHEGIEAAVTHLIGVAKRMELKGIIAFTRDITVHTRALNLHGFTATPDAVLALSLTRSN